MTRDILKKPLLSLPVICGQNYPSTLMVLLLIKDTLLDPRMDFSCLLSEL